MDANSPFRSTCAVLLLLVATALPAAPPQVVVLPVFNQPPHSLLDTVRPLVGEHGSVSAFGDKLIVQGSPAQIDAVRNTLRQIDRPPRRLIIEVRLAGDLSSHDSETAYGAQTERLRLGSPPGGRGAAVYHRELQTRGRNESLQRVQAIDGRPALIRAGQSMPTYQSYQTIIGNRIVQGFDMHYRDTSSGFFALPRVHGDQVTVEIYQQQENPEAGGRVDFQHASTVLRGKVGEWLTLGSVSSDDGDNIDRLGRHARTQRSAERQIGLRVLPVD